MNDESNQSIQDEMLARLVAEAQATVPRDMAEFVRIAVKYKIDADTFIKIIGDATGSVPSPSPQQRAFRRIFDEVIDSYFTHERSPFLQLKHSVAIGYARSLKRMAKEFGKDHVADWNAETVRIHHQRWSEDGKKIAMGHELIAKLRLLTSFGATELDDDGCIRLNGILGSMRFPVSKGDGQPRLTREQARAIRITAREHFGWDSIALAAALQFELPKLRHVDIIGEWAPLSDSDKSDIMKGSEKWVRGLRWSDIDENMMLRRTLTSGRRNQHKTVEYSLRRSQMTMEEINRVPAAKRNGPMIICEFSGIPWTGPEFRRKWRIVAEKAGVYRQSAAGADEHESEAETAS